MSQGYRILLAEDEDQIRDVLVDALVAKGFEVIGVEDGKRAKELLQIDDFDLALLDVCMPEASGFGVLEWIREQDLGIPVIMLTARSEEEDRIRGLNLGADDYVVKPFSIRELIARIEAVLRRAPRREVAQKKSNEWRLPGAKLDQQTYQLHFDHGGMVSLTEREYELLSYLMSHEGELVSRDELLLRVWKMDPRLTETKTVEMTMVRLRNKLGEDLSKSIETLRGKGYRWIGRRE
jgi:DNA-binding response OmpR family regulator